MRTSRLRTSREIDGRDVEERTFEFAVAILRLAKEYDAELPKAVADNLIARGTALGSAVAESHASGSRRHALSKMMAARRASQETEYWLRLVQAAELVPDDAVEPLLEEVQGLESTITALCVKARQALETDANK